MQQLIDFLLENIYFVIVIIGIVYAMFFRKSPLERPPNRMPDFGGGGWPRPPRPAGRPQPPAERPAWAPEQQPSAERPAWTPEPQPSAERPAWAPEPQPPQRPAWAEARPIAEPSRRRPHPAEAWGPLRETSPRPAAEPWRADDGLTGEGTSGGEGALSPVALPARSEPLASVATVAPGGASARAVTDAARPQGGPPRADELARAVLWAEILGPPRAKRPLRRY